VLLRAKALHLLLSFGILLSQQAAVLNGIAELAGHVPHVADRPAVVSLGSDQPDVDTCCPECLAFAQVTNAAPGLPIDIALPSVPDARSCIPVQRLLGAATSFPFDARAPPAIT